MPAIEATKLTKAFGKRKAVDEVSFELPEKTFLTIFGPNGAGKTSLLRLLSTLSRPTSGSAQLFGLDIKEKADEVRGHIGYISHNPMVYPDLSALDNLLFVAKLYGVAQPEKRALELLEAVELKHRRDDVVSSFSRGMTQRLSIARALVHDPDIIFLDEPYSGLDPHAVSIFDSMLEQNRTDRTLVMVSHDFKKGYDMCTHALVMSKGKVVAFGEKDQVTLSDIEAVYESSSDKRGSRGI